MNMLKKTFKILLIIGHGLFFPSFIFAETVVFKSGQTLDTKIIEKTDKYIRVEVDSARTVLSYPLEQIESIDGRRLESISKTNSTAQGSLAPYSNALDTEYTEFNNIFKIKLPRGWEVLKKSRWDTTQIGVIKPNTPNGFIITPLPTNIVLSSDIFREDRIKALENENRKFFKKQYGIVVDKQLTKTTFQGIPALRSDIDLPEQGQRQSKISFIKEGYAFNIVIATSISEFSLYNGIISDSLNTFEVLPKTQQQANQRNNKVNVIGAFKQGFSEGRIKANEDVAYRLCKVYARTFEVYKERNQNYPTSFKELDNKGYLSPSDPYNRLILQSKPAQSYYYRYSYIDENHFILKAEPAQQGVTGIKTFRVDETGVVNALK